MLFDFASKLPMKKVFLKNFIFITLLFAAFTVKISAQQVVDKIVATVSDGVRTQVITYSDLMWQLALEPDVSINPPSSDDLNRALQTTINQRLITLEAQRLPSIRANEKEIEAKIKDTLERFTTQTEFIERLKKVGFESAADENFRKIMEQRVAIEKYLDFRFRSFVVVTPEDEMRYYQEIYLPKFRKENPGMLMPTLNQLRPQINQILTETKISNDIDKFLENAKDRAEIVYLNDV
jgi:hypothetical protein